MTALGDAWSRLCLGANVFGWTVDESGAHAILDAYHARGGAFIDTADIYPTWAAGAGVSERIIGSWLADRGLEGEIVVATKVGCAMPEGAGLARTYVLDSAERSRERLGVETIDVLYAHRPDPTTPILETMQAFDELVRRGTVRDVALSNYEPAQLRDALDACAAHDLARPVLLQPNYNLVHRDEYEGGLADTCVAERIDVAPYFSLAAGFLTGKYRRDAPPPPSPRAQGTLAHYGNPRGWNLLERAEQVATRHGATISQVAIAWLLTRPAVVAPIASATTVDQLDELMGALDLVLDAEDLELLD